MPKLYNLTKLECKVLYKKYKMAGLTTEQANNRINLIRTNLKNSVEKMKLKNKSDAEIEKHFQKEFEKICQEAEGMN